MNNNLFHNIINSIDKSKLSNRQTNKHRQKKGKSDSDIKEKKMFEAESCTDTISNTEATIIIAGLQQGNMARTRIIQASKYMRRNRNKFAYSSQCINKFVC